MYRGVITEVTLLKKLRLELCVEDDKAEEAMQAIAEGARTGKEGDGVIYMVEGIKGFRVRTGRSTLTPKPAVWLLSHGSFPGRRSPAEAPL